ncbi:Os07g0643200 [Oryza sativa Japonica Group]|uniref:Os07g0643200 protein n=1 Tax=Oryza sativa subsp. japonica TaxID=39947 RepID=A0A0P0X9G5_ORYSJ|nr:Os07g0643200 [Oryza sativa Japonica Group]
MGGVIRGGVEKLGREMGKGKVHTSPSSSSIHESIRKIPTNPDSAGDELELVVASRRDEEDNEEAEEVEDAAGADRPHILSRCPPRDRVTERRSGGERGGGGGAPAAWTPTVRRPYIRHLNEYWKEQQEWVKAELAAHGYVECEIDDNGDNPCTCGCAHAGRGEDEEEGYGQRLWMR